MLRVKSNLGIGYGHMTILMSTEELDMSDKVS